MLSTIWDALKSILTNRTFAVPIISSILMLLVSNDVISVNNADLWTERIFQIMLILMGMNGSFDLLNVAKGNTWDVISKSWK